MRFLLGFGIGVVLGIIFAPAPGEETRAQFADKLKNLAHAPQRKVQQTMEEVAAQAEAKAGDIGSKVGREVAEAAVKAVRSEVLNDTGERRA